MPIGNEKMKEEEKYKTKEEILIIVLLRKKKKEADYKYISWQNSNDPFIP